MSHTAGRLLKVLPGLAAVALALGILLIGTPFVLAAPTDPDFDVNPNVPLPGRIATFTAMNLKTGDSVSWDFDNDGIFDATGRTTQHVFPTPGQQSVLMRVTSASNAVTDVRKTVRVDAPPTASFTASPNPATVGDPVQFDATASSDSDGRIVSYEWDLDGNGSFETSTGSTPTTSKAYADTGTVNVKLRVTDNNRATAETTVPVVVNNHRPVARFTASPNPAFVGQSMTFDAAGSSDPDGTIASYQWDLDNDGQFDDASGITTSYPFGVAGPHTVGLLVTDNRGATDTVTSTVTVNDAPLSTPSSQPPGGVVVVQRPVFISPAPVAPPLVAPQPRLMSPFPIVRLVATLGKKGAKVKLLLVSGAPVGARITVRCRGRGCPVRERSKSMVAGPVRFRALEAKLRAGVWLEIFVTQPGKIGKYTSFKIRRSRAPLRQDLCVVSTSAKPAACPSS